MCPRWGAAAWISMLGLSSGDDGSDLSSGAHTGIDVEDGRCHIEWLVIWDSWRHWWLWWIVLQSRQNGASNIARSACATYPSCCCRLGAAQCRLPPYQTAGRSRLHKIHGNWHHQCSGAVVAQTLGACAWWLIELVSEAPADDATAVGFGLANSLGFGRKFWQGTAAGHLLASTSQGPMSRHRSIEYIVLSRSKLPLKHGE